MEKNKATAKQSKTGTPSQKIARNSTKDKPAPAKPKEDKTPKSTNAKPAKQVAKKNTHPSAAGKNSTKAKTPEGSVTKAKATKQPQPSAAKPKVAPKDAQAKTAKQPKPKSEPKTPKMRDGRATAAKARVYAPLARPFDIPGALVPLREAERIATLDKDLLSTDPAFPVENRWQYYFCINTWACMLRDLDEKYNCSYLHHAERLVAEIRHSGLIPTIRSTCAEADALVHDRVGNEFSFFHAAYHSMHDKLQALRWPKRFTPLCGDKLADEAVKAWRLQEKKNRAENNRNIASLSKRWWIIGCLRDLSKDWFLRYRSVNEASICRFRDHWRSVRIPTGASFNPKAKLREKVADLACTLREGRYLWFRSAPVNRDRESKPLLKAYNYVAGGVRIDRRAAFNRFVRKDRLIPVPKNYKTPRIVCPEEPVNQIMQRVIADEMYRSLPTAVKRHLPINDQVRNQILAHCGVELDIATVDFSHASDSQTACRVADLLPSRVAADLDYWRPTHTVLPDGTIVRLEQFGPMGTGNTWTVMGIILLMCALLACEWSCVPSDRIAYVSVFGDDVTIPAEALENFLFITSLLGFEINQDKTFSSGARYRESCGAEWYTHEDGTVEDCRTLYYPRFPVGIKDEKEGMLPSLRTARDYNPQTGEFVITDTLSRFVALQHATFYEYPHTADFLTYAILALEPRMTMSVPGSDCSDCWTAIPHGPVRLLKHLCGSETIPTYVDDYGVEQSCVAREGHLCPSAELPVVRSADRSLEIQEYDYLKFLLEGPMPPDDPVLAQLNEWWSRGRVKSTISTRPRQSLESPTSIEWVLRY